MDIVLWVLLFFVAVFDAREYRIPNKLLLLIISYHYIYAVFVGHQGFEYLGNSLLSGVSAFLIGLLFYFLKAMAPGDVKLFFVIGSLVTLEQLPSLGYWILIASGGVGILYALLHAAGKEDLRNHVMNYYSYKFFYGGVNSQLISTTVRLENKLVMPLAPSIIIGFALYNYLV